MPHAHTTCSQHALKLTGAEKFRHMFRFSFSRNSSPSWRVVGFVVTSGVTCTGMLPVLALSCVTRCAGPRPPEERGRRGPKLGGVVGVRCTGMRVLGSVCDNVLGGAKRLQAGFVLVSDGLRRWWLEWATWQRATAGAATSPPPQREGHTSDMWPLSPSRTFGLGREQACATGAGG